jgi:SNF2 family DNA or RNA helicase
MSAEAVTRIASAQGEFVCPICLDGSTNPAILLPCGHAACSECFTQLCDTTAQRDGEGGSLRIKCPVCRGAVNPKEITDYMSFKRVHQPELLTETEKDDSETDSETDSDSDDTDSVGSLEDFVVDDLEASEDEDSKLVKEESKPSLKEKKLKSKKSKGKKKGKQPVKDDESDSEKVQTLAKLKKESLKNKKAKRKYFKQLDKIFTPSTKIARTIQLIEEIFTTKPAEKVLVFSQFTTMLDFMEVPLRRAGIDYVRYDGSMSSSERNRAVEEFRRSQTCKVMILSLKAGNAGLNLNIASQVVILDPFWNPYIEEQAIDRAHRIGQRWNVEVHRIVIPDTVEDRILKLQEQKREIITAALSEEEGRQIGRLGMRELQFLFGIDSRN